MDYYLLSFKIFGNIMINDDHFYDGNHINGLLFRWEILMIWY